MLKKLASALFNLVYTFAVVYVLFINPITAVINIIMLLVNIDFFVTIIAVFSNEETQTKINENVLLHPWIGVIQNISFALMFAAVGWWYYAIISILTGFFGLSLFSKRLFPKL